LSTINYQLSIINHPQHFKEHGAIPPANAAGDGGLVAPWRNEGGSASTTLGYHAWTGDAKRIFKYSCK